MSSILICDFTQPAETKFQIFMEVKVDFQTSVIECVINLC